VSSAELRERWVRKIKIMMRKEKSEMRIKLQL
jgi:hypothetical protein